jgi:mannose-binding lectin 2
MGWLWSRLPIKAENYEIEVEFNVSQDGHSESMYTLMNRCSNTSFRFQVNGKGHSLFGDGFAMWLTTDRAKPGPVFGSIGESRMGFLS